MSVLLKSMVDNKTLYGPAFLHLFGEDNKYIRDLEDSEIDELYYKVYASKDEGNFKQFTIKFPFIKLTLGDYVFKLFQNEMIWENYHNIQYKKVDNKEFHKRLKKYKTQKFRFYYKDRWITYYFNQVSKSRATEEDFVVNSMLQACYPRRGIPALLSLPCVGKMISEGLCSISTIWGTTLFAFTKPIPKEYYPELYKRWEYATCVAPLDVTDTEWEEYYRNYIINEDYFYTKPGDNDYIIEAYTFDYDRSSQENLKPTEYYILDREGYYFKEGKTDFELIKNKALEKHNESCSKRIIISTGRDTRNYDNFYRLERVYYDIGTAIKEGNDALFGPEDNEEAKVVYETDSTNTVQDQNNNTQQAETTEEEDTTPKVGPNTCFYFQEVDGKFFDPDDMHFFITRDLIMRFNWFKQSWNSLIDMFNGRRDKDGWFCYYKDYNRLTSYLHITDDFNADSAFDATGELNVQSGTLVKQLFDVKTYDLSVITQEDIKILDWVAYGSFNIKNDKNTEYIAINVNTDEDFLNYAIINPYAWSVDAY